MCYNEWSAKRERSTMQKEIPPVDITNLPELLNLAEEVRTTKTPRLLKRGDQEIAMLTPIAPVPQPASPKLRELAHRLAGSLANVEIPGWESSEAAERWVEELRQADTFPFEPKHHP